MNHELKTNHKSRATSHVYAAVMTGKGVGAISTIQVFGEKAEAIIKKIFKTAGTKPVIFRPGKILLGQIVDGSETIDQVTIGCEGPGNYAISCHSNPIIVEITMKLLQQHGVKLLKTEQLLYKILSFEEKSINTIALEAKLVQPKARTLEGTKIVINQIDTGLNRIATKWQKNINTISINEITAKAKWILQRSQTAKLIIAGGTAVIVGAPNSGKSTLLNCLAGRQKAIVTNIKGTTRDYISTRCKMGSLSIKLIDTAGLDKNLITTQNTLEKTFQEKTVQLLEDADLVLLVLDNNQDKNQLDEKLLERVTNKKVLTILNKSDLPVRFDINKLPKSLSNTTLISAKFETGIEELIKKIQQLCGTTNFDLKNAVCFTSRQENLLKQLANTETKQSAASIITELLNGQFCV